jgi:ketosteroid isomerase-like protein
MSQKHVETLMRAFDLVGEDPEAFYSIFDERVEWHTGFVFPDATSYRGVDGVREFFRTWIGTFEDWGFEVEEVLDIGDSVVILLHQWGRGKGSGAEVELRFWQVWTFAEGKVVRCVAHFDKAGALEAASGGAQA